MYAFDPCPLSAPFGWRGGRALDCKFKNDRFEFGPINNTKQKKLKLEFCIKRKKIKKISSMNQYSTNADFKDTSSITFSCECAQLSHPRRHKALHGICQASKKWSDVLAFQASWMLEATMWTTFLHSELRIDYKSIE